MMQPRNATTATAICAYPASGARQPETRPRRRAAARGCPPRPPPRALSAGRRAEPRAADAGDGGRGRAGQAESEREAAHDASDDRQRRLAAAQALQRLERGRDDGASGREGCRRLERDGAAHGQPSARPSIPSRRSRRGHQPGQRLDVRSHRMAQHRRAAEKRRRQHQAGNRQTRSAREMERQARVAGGVAEQLRHHADYNRRCGVRCPSDAKPAARCRPISVQDDPIRTRLSPACSAPEPCAWSLCGAPGSGLLAATPAQAAAPQDYLAQARQLASSGQRPAAIKLLEDRLAATPTISTPGRCSASSCRGRAGTRRRARNCARCCRTGPATTRRWSALANVELWDGHADLALGLADGRAARQPEGHRESCWCGRARSAP